MDEERYAYDGFIYDELGQIKGIQFKVVRDRMDKFPFKLGECTPTVFAQNKRGVAGQIAYLAFDRDSLLSPDDVP